jgi:hypothetical protein
VSVNRPLNSLVQIMEIPRINLNLNPIRLDRIHFRRTPKEFSLAFP